MALVSVLKSVAGQISPELEGLNTSAQAFVTQELGRYVAFEVARKSGKSGESDGTEKAETGRQVVRYSPTIRAKRLRTIQREFQAARRALQRLKKSIPKVQALISETQASLRSCHLSPFCSALVVAVPDVTKPRKIVNSDEWLNKLSATLQVTLTRIEKELNLIDSPQLKRARESEIVTTSVDALYYVLDRIFRAKRPRGPQLTIRESHRRITRIVGKLELKSVEFAAHGKAPAVEKAIERLEPGVKKALDQRLYENLQIPPLS